MLDLMLSDTTSIRYLIPEYDPRLEHEYTPYELVLLAEYILLNDRSEGPEWLNGSQYVDRCATEIYVASGVPDPAIQAGSATRSPRQARKPAGSCRARRPRAELSARREPA